MKMTKKGWIVTGVIAGTLALGTALHAAEVATMPGGHHGALMQRLAGTPLGNFLSKRAGNFRELQRQLNLTEEQKTAFQEALKDHKSEMATAIKPVVEAKRALRDAVLADTPDETAIRADADKLGKTIGDAAVAMSKIKADIKERVKLTPEQEATLKKFRAERDSDVDALLNQPK